MVLSRIWLQSAFRTQNLDTPLITKGSDHFDTSLWTGNVNNGAILAGLF